MQRMKNSLHVITILIILFFKNSDFVVIKNIYLPDFGVDRHTSYTFTNLNSPRFIAQHLLSTTFPTPTTFFLIQTIQL